MQQKITNDMLIGAEKISPQRENYIRHHFTTKHYNTEMTNKIGYLGEFACAEMFGLDWQKIVKVNKKSDDYDLLIGNFKIDVKTDTVPTDFFLKLINGTLTKTERYYERWIHESQYEFLDKYDVMLFGVIERNSFNAWHPIGWITTENIIKNYPPTTNPPHSNHKSSKIPVNVLNRNIMQLLPLDIKNQYKLNFQNL